MGSPNTKLVAGPLCVTACGAVLGIAAPLGSEAKAIFTPLTANPGDIVEVAGQQPPLLVDQFSIDLAAVDLDVLGVKPGGSSVPAALVSGAEHPLNRVPGSAVTSTGTVICVVGADGQTAPITVVFDEAGAGYFTWESDAELETVVVPPVRGAICS